MLKFPEQFETYLEDNNSLTKENSIDNSINSEINNPINPEINNPINPEINNLMKPSRKARLVNILRRSRNFYRNEKNEHGNKIAIKNTIKKGLKVLIRKISNKK